MKRPMVLRLISGLKLTNKRAAMRIRGREAPPSHYSDSPPPSEETVQKDMHLCANCQRHGLLVPSMIQVPWSKRTSYAVLR